MASGHDDEYQFTDLEEEDLYTAAEQRVIQAKEGPENESWKHMLWIVGGLVIAGFVGYKLFDVYFPHKTITTTPVKPISAVPTLPTQPSKPVLVPQPVAPVTSPAPSSAAMDEAIRNAVTVSMAEQKQIVSADLAKMDSNINEIKTNMAALTLRLDTLAKSLDTLVQEAEKKREPAPIAVPQVKKTIVFKPKHRVKAMPAELFYLQAVIPGRAWLIGENGTTLTVSQGDLVPGYGKVFSIDAEGGKLKTESGKMITFHPNEQ